MSLSGHTRCRTRSSPSHLLGDLCWTAGTVGVFYVGVTLELPAKPLPTFFAALLSAWLFALARCLDRQPTDASLIAAAQDVATMTRNLILLATIASPLYWRAIPLLGGLPASYANWLGGAVLLGAAGWFVKHPVGKGTISTGSIALLIAMGLADILSGVVRAL